ncbi:exonuclease domain-containing protein [Streptomyces sp. NBC_01498]|uniref:3'-5' exonuclease n=1 Tax=Streptomyces sp. NBC_01498 TaxID=2975870 RepID=UPI002E7B579C|nr:3'-5' exonuclease [Streptomyces sp. NBC_01498]WTL23182.1 exonuclease domain-containing protein [Streptomyces sp. NBC_01498]
MNAAEHLLNVVDVGATCWEGQPPPGQASEIIGVGLTVVELRAGERLAKHRLLVRPARSTISPFRTELTGLTPTEVDGGLSFAEACRTLAARHRTGLLPWAGWGDYDRDRFTRQCRRTRAAYPFGHRHTNAKVAFTAAHALRGRPGMAQALKIADLPLEGRHHRGADDAWNIAALVLDLSGRGAWPGIADPDRC